MMRVVRGVLLLVAAGLCIGAIGLAVLIGKGVSARDEPSRLEISVAGRLRHIAIPRAARERTNPLPASAENVKAGMEHFADHCAVCHANNGSAQTPFGRGLYPRPPDLRGYTQALSDGEIFWIIDNGVKLTGMPAFGGGADDAAGEHHANDAGATAHADDHQGEEPHGEEDTWKLVLFIRHLPTITDAEVNAMKKLNPHTADEDQEEKKIDDFLHPRHDHGDAK